MVSFAQPQESPVTRSEENAIETIDFSGFLAGNDESRKSVAKAIFESFKTIGFVCLTNHGLPQDKVEAMFTMSKSFFDLPMDKKMLAPHPPEGGHHRGYSAPGRELVSQHVYDRDDLKALREQSKDYKESFESGRADDPIMPNIWPPDDVLPGFKEACLDFYWTCYELEKNLLRALGVAFELGEEYFTSVHKNADSQLRLLHYPSAPYEDEGVSRISAHTDFDTFTILFQDDVGGLEIEDPNMPGSYLPVKPVPNSVVVNAGDFLAMWSNDTLKSTSHRVVAPPSAAVGGIMPSRYSIPYFCACDFNTVVDAIPGTWGEGRPKKYEPTSAMEYIMKRFATAY
ncbi:hypothetical protein D9611_012413 [Ephemerocybe angulata]|uniref:Fe2OG dioxygenase domain-containing protein n=1 Tax=Ephemerocybe angulata TaxID=980116 RepID=A0A8H5FJZ5_9AGAR|nr:hypothetical protein D9611_012413 [Tulosesus angulatus]